MAIVFYTIYISAGLVGLGYLLETLFALPYTWGIFIGMLVVVPYVFIGGYTTLAWIDLFQGLFLMCVIIFVPFYVMHQLGGWDVVMNAITAKHISLAYSLIPNRSHSSPFSLLLSAGDLGILGSPIS